MPPWLRISKVYRPSDYGNLTTNQISCQRLQPLVLALGPAVIDRHVLALDEARVFQALAERPLRQV